MEPSTEDTLAADDGADPATASTSGERGPSPPGDERVLAVGERLGRYSVLEILGSGAMGVVYAAYDAELDRRVAIKILQPTRAGDEAQVRLQREAQALARLSHPNVVGVHDVGTHAGQVFVAMEFVAGETFAELDWEAMSWSEAVAAYREAGRGLRAAHRAGLVHRDFKPANVMRRDDGRVVVMDFGLARAAEDAAVDGAEQDGAGEGGAPDQQGAGLEESMTASSSHFDAQLTRTGSMLGTPAYMAPEQFAGAAADARSDQFGFCVSLWEALYGQRPFAGRSFAELAFSVTNHKLSPPTRDPKDVPAAIHEALLRGLAAKPDERWPDMGALLEALSVDPRRARRVAFGVLGGLAVLVAVAVAAYTLGGGRAEPKDEAPPVCAGADARIAEVWGEAEREQLREHLGGLDLGYAESAATRVVAQLDRYAGEWSAMYSEACRATHVRREQSEEILDLRMTCLDRRRQELDALVEILASADAELLPRARQAAGGLSPVAQCGDVEALRAVTPLPSTGELRARVDALGPELARVRALLAAASYEQAQAIIEATRGDLPPEYPPIRAEHGHLEGDLLIRLGRYDEARVVLRRALLDAVRSGDDLRAGKIITSLAFVTGYLDGDVERGHELADLALAYAERTGNGQLHSAALGQKGIMFHSQSKLAQAIERYEACIEVLPKDAPNYSIDVAARLYNLALARREYGQPQAALADLKRSLELYTDAYGPTHPDVIDTHDAIGSSLYQLGRLDEAEEVLEGVLARRAEALGEDHFGQGSTHNTLANIAFDRGDYEGARRHYERARELIEREHGPEHFRVADLLRALGQVSLAEHDYDEAEELYTEALRIRKASQGEASVATGGSYTDLAGLAQARGRLPRALELLDQADAAIEVRDSLEAAGVAEIRGEVLFELGRLEPAEAQLRRALDIIREARGPRTVRAAYAALSLAKLLSATGEHDEAVELVEEALEIREEIGVSPRAVAEARFALARALHARGDDPERPRELAEQARESLQKAGERESVAELEAWLAKLSSAPR